MGWMEGIPVFEDVDSVVQLGLMPDGVYCEVRTGPLPLTGPPPLLVWTLDDWFRQGELGYFAVEYGDLENKAAYMLDEFERYHVGNGRRAEEERPHMGLGVGFWLLLCLMLVGGSGCGNAVKAYLDAATARDWQGCHCLTVRSGAGYGAYVAAEVKSQLATGGTTLAQCAEVQTCQ